MSCVCGACCSKSERYGCCLGPQVIACLGGAGVRRVGFRGGFLHLPTSRYPWIRHPGSSCRDLRCLCCDEGGHADRDALAVDGLDLAVLALEQHAFAVFVFLEALVVVVDWVEQHGYDVPDSASV